MRRSRFLVGAVAASGLVAARADAALVGSGRTLASSCAYVATVLSDQPTAFYRLNESAGTTTCYDSSGNGHNLAYGAAVQLGTKGVLPNGACTDSAAFFPNASGTADIAQSSGRISALEPTGSISVEAWFSLSTVNPILVCYGSWTGQYYLIRYNNSWIFGANIGGSNAEAGATASGISTTSPVHMVGTYDGSTIRTYLQGAQITSTPASGAIGNYASGLAIGRGYGASGLSPLNGTIQDVAIYANAVLSPQRIAAHYHTGK